MKITQPNQKSRIAIIALMLLMVFQSCSKDDTLQPDDLNNALAKAKNEANSLSEFVGVAPESCKQVCLVAGQHMNVGTVDVAMENGDLYVTYNITASNVYLEEVHLDVFSSLEQFKADKKISNGGATPGKFVHKMAWEANMQKTSHTAVIPASYLAQLSTDCFFIASHAALSNGETAWGGLCTETENGVSIDEAKQFPGKNWSVYFEFCPDECAQSVDFTYAWEDLKNKGNDADYNDLVIKSSILKSKSELKISFTANARGAGYDHKFKIKIPKAGITGIFGDDSHTEDANFYYITVFNSTKAVLPTAYANTKPVVGCAPVATKEVVLTINSSFTYNPAIPYEPFISVYPSGGTSSGGFYDLYIYEVSGSGTWVDGSGKVYPNGILIPSDWQWPTERTKITLAYPDFSNLTDGWNANWASNLADPSKVFNLSDCE